MNTRVIVAAVAGGAALFLFGFLIFGLLLDPMVFRPNSNVYAGLMKDPPDWLPLILANIVNGFLLAYIFDKMAGIRTAVAGASAGAVLSFLISLGRILFFAAFMNLSKNYMPAIADLLGSIVLGAVSGAVIGWVLGAMSKDSAAATA
jgi:hypothetical protein